MPQDFAVCIDAHAPRSVQSQYGYDQTLFAKLSAHPGLVGLSGELRICKSCNDRYKNACTSRRKSVAAASAAEAFDDDGDLQADLGAAGGGGNLLSILQAAGADGGALAEVVEGAGAVGEGGIAAGGGCGAPSPAAVVPASPIDDGMEVDSADAAGAMVGAGGRKRKLEPGTSRMLPRRSPRKRRSSFPSVSAEALGRGLSRSWLSPADQLVASGAEVRDVYTGALVPVSAMKGVTKPATYAALPRAVAVTTGRAAADAANQVAVPQGFTLRSTTDSLYELALVQTSVLGKAGGCLARRGSVSRATAHPATMPMPSLCEKGLSAGWCVGACAAAAL